MSRHSRLETLTRIKELGLVPIFNTHDIALASSIVKACYDGGAMVVEFTNRGDRVIDIFRQLAIFRDTELPEMILGAGSVMDAPTAAMYIAAGADFIVSPVLDEQIAVLCNGRKIPFMPGCGTVTEIHKAHTLGVEFCKLFPGDCLGGPAFIKSVIGPMPWTEIIAMGGIAPTEESLGEWFNAGASCVGMSSNLFPKRLLEIGDFEQIRGIVRQTFEIIEKVRSRML
ncbi:MAG: bifunctional 4-hydroxy-2-oxoglutarate aldolase/2-dehydro-3-deoxy-phosphogluconate aldolase [Planctomycetota bacterium]